MADLIAYPLAAELLECLCTALEGSLSGPPCRCCIYPGAAVPADSCCECDGGQGQAWVRVARIYPIIVGRFPNQMFEPTRCDTHRAWAVELELGVYRCLATLDDDGNPPTCEQLEHDAQMIADDAAAMRVAARCCFAGRDRDMVMGAWAPIGPSGGCGGGSMTLTVQAWDCECPPAEEG